MTREEFRKAVKNLKKTVEGAAKYFNEVNRVEEFAAHDPEFARLFAENRRSIVALGEYIDSRMESK